MNIIKRILPVLLLASAPILAQETAARPAKTAIVDMVRLMDAYEKSKRLEKSLEDRFKKEEQKLKDLMTERDALKDELKVAGEAKKEELSMKMQELEIKHKLAKESLEKTLMSQQRRYTQEVYFDIKDAVALYGKEKKFDIILKKSSYDKDNEQQMQMEMMSNMVLFNEESLDITDEVLTLLNAKFLQLESKAGNKEEKQP